MNYYESDVGEPPEQSKKPKKASNDFGVTWADHVNRLKEEAARIPEGYKINLGI